MSGMMKMIKLKGLKMRRKNFGVRRRVLIRSVDLDDWAICKYNISLVHFKNATTVNDDTATQSQSFYSSTTLKTPFPLRKTRLLLFPITCVNCPPTSTAHVSLLFFFPEEPIFLFGLLHLYPIRHSPALSRGRCHIQSRPTARPYDRHPHPAAENAEKSVPHRLIDTAQIDVPYSQEVSDIPSHLFGEGVLDGHLVDESVVQIFSRFVKEPRDRSPDGRNRVLVSTYGMEIILVVWNSSLWWRKFLCC